MIHLELPYLPPTTNNAYINLPGGGRATSTKATNFLVSAQTYFAQKYRGELLFFTTKKDVRLTLALRFTMLQEEIENKGWPAKKGVARYKQVDTTNRIKLVEDALAKAAGVDDRQNFTVALQKCVGPKEKTDLWVWDPKEEDSPFDRAFQQLG